MYRTKNFCRIPVARRDEREQISEHTLANRFPKATYVVPPKWTPQVR